MVTKEIDILMITQIKLDDSFPVRLDRNKNGGGILLYTRIYITAQLNKYIIKNQI